MMSVAITEARSAPRSEPSVENDPGCVKSKRCLDHIGFRFDAGRFPHVMWQAGLQ